MVLFNVRKVVGGTVVPFTCKKVVGGTVTFYLRNLVRGYGGSNIRRWSGYGGSF